MSKVQKIKFRGKEYWLANSIYSDGNISPLNHFDNDGNLLVGFNKISYAVIEGDEINRFGRTIGHRNEIEFMEKKNDH